MVCPRKTQERLRIDISCKGWCEIKFHVTKSGWRLLPGAVHPSFYTLPHIYSGDILCAKLKMSRMPAIVVGMTESWKENSLQVCFGNIVTSNPFSLSWMQNIISQKNQGIFWRAIQHWPKASASDWYGGYPPNRWLSTQWLLSEAPQVTY